MNPSHLAGNFEHLVTLLQSQLCQLCYPKTKEYYYDYSFLNYCTSVNKYSKQFKIANQMAGIHSITYQWTISLIKINIYIPGMQTPVEDR